MNLHAVRLVTMLHFASIILINVSSKHNFLWKFENLNVDRVICNYKMSTGDPYADHDFFTDGLWHSVHIDIIASQGSTVGRINITVDGRPDVSNRQLRFTASTDFYIGGNYHFKEFH